MGLYYSIHDVSVILNDNQLEGFSDDTDAISLPQLTLGEGVFGLDGTLLAVSSGEYGGEVTFKFLASSATIPLMMSYVLEAQRGAYTVFNGKIWNARERVGTDLIRGFLRMGEIGQTIGKASVPPREYTFMFERLVPTYEGSRNRAIDVLDELGLPTTL